MKPSNILAGLVGILAMLLLSNTYRGLTNNFTTNRQALIAGGLTTIGLALFIALIAKVRTERLR